MKTEFRSIDSHSSQLNNQELSLLSMEIDSLALSAGSSERFQEVRAFYVAVKQYYRKVACVLNPDDLASIEQYRMAAERLLEYMINDAEYRTRSASHKLYQLVEQLHFLIRNAMQRNAFYFRTSIKNPKGLNEIRFTDALMEEGGEDGEQGDVQSDGDN